MPEEPKLPHFIGHRSRLKDKFRRSPSSLPDYELLELILFWAVPRRDTKPLAKKLLAEFTDLQNIINADVDKLLTIPGVTEGICTNFLILREYLNRSLQQSVIKKNVLSSWGALVDYLKATMGVIKTEQFRILYLNKKNILIADELQTVGTVDQTPVYPREVVKRALFHEATAIILVHNHPSGDPTPSQADIELTKEIVKACGSLSVTVHDHVIISKNQVFSFKSNFLL